MSTSRVENNSAYITNLQKTSPPSTIRSALNAIKMVAASLEALTIKAPPKAFESLCYKGATAAITSAVLAILFKSGKEGSLLSNFPSWIDAPPQTWFIEGLFKGSLATHLFYDYPPCQNAFEKFSKEKLNQEILNTEREILRLKQSLEKDPEKGTYPLPGINKINSDIKAMEDTLILLVKTSKERSYLADSLEHFAVSNNLVEPLAGPDYTTQTSKVVTWAASSLGIAFLGTLLHYAFDSEHYQTHSFSEYVGNLGPEIVKVFKETLFQTP